MIYYIICLTFGITFYIKYMDIKVYDGKLNWMDILGMLFFSLLAPVLVTTSLAIWCHNQIKTI